MRQIFRQRLVAAERSEAALGLVALNTSLSALWLPTGPAPVGARFGNQAAHLVPHPFLSPFGQTLTLRRWERKCGGGDRRVVAKPCVHRCNTYGGYISTRETGTPSVSHQSEMAKTTRLRGIGGQIRLVGGGFNSTTSVVSNKRAGCRAKAGGPFLFLPGHVSRDEWLECRWRQELLSESRGRVFRAAFPARFEYGILPPHGSTAR